jgi:hypothetical protein
LLSLQNSRSLDKLNDELRASSENLAYLATQAQISNQETAQAIALDSAESELRVEGALAASDSQGQQTQALLRGTEERSSINNALVQAVGASSEEQQGVLSQLQKMPEQQRASTIASLLDAAASSGGTNAALKMLADLSNTGTTALAQAARAEESQAAKAQAARASASASTNLSLATEGAATTQAQLNQASRENQVALGNLDAATTRRVGEQSFASQRLSTSGAKAASDLASGVERSARSTQLAANEEVLKKGASLSAATASAQAGAVKSPGFFDYLSVGANAVSTYSNQGGNFGFLSRPSSPRSSAIRQGSDFGNIPPSIG